MPYVGLGDAHEASLYRNLVKSLPEYAIFRIGVNGLIESWNTGVERLLGYPESEFLGLPFAELFTPEDRESGLPQRELDTATQEGRAPDTRWHLRSDRTRFFCDGVLTRIDSDAGQIVGFTKVMHDMTGRKLAEQRSAELVQALDLTHTVIRELDGTILLWTQGAEFLYGWSKEEALGRRTHDLLRTKFPAPLSTINDSLLNAGEWQGELLHTTKEGRTVSVASHWMLRPRGDEHAHVIEVNNDVSALRGLHAELQKVNAKLERAVSELASFAYEVAHDIQAPLRGITGLAELVAGKLQGTVSEEDSELLGSIVHSSRKLKNLVDSLLQYASVESMPNDVEPFGLDDILREVRSNLADMIEAASAEVTWEAMPTVYGHRVRILRLLQNLVSNAIKYARPNVPAVIRISAKRVPDEWRIDVEDNGAGIPANMREKIFAPLTRLHGAEIPGSGLGLAICKRVAEGEGGRIWVDSVVGQGSVFHVTIPAKTPGSE